MAKRGRPNKSLVDLIVDRYVNLELFYRKQEPQPNGCIEWTGVKNNIGYGFIGFRSIDPITGEPAKGDAGMMTTHRLAWMIEHKRLPTKRNINHTCHNKLCVNPTHLEEGTQRDKLDAMIKDGIKGGRNLGSSGYAYDHKQEGRKYKYSEEEIRWIRQAHPTEIAEKYNIPVERAATRRWAFRKGYQWLKD
jgi:hypothetical protein